MTLLLLLTSSHIRSRLTKTDLELCCFFSWKIISLVSQACSRRSVVVSLGSTWLPSSSSSSLLDLFIYLLLLSIITALLVACCCQLKQIDACMVYQNNGFFFYFRLLISFSSFHIVFSFLLLLSPTHFFYFGLLVSLFLSSFPSWVLFLLSSTRFFFCCQIGAFVYQNGSLLLSIVAVQTKRRALAASCC